MRDLHVNPVTIAGMAGFQIHGLHRACSDSFWEVAAHPAVFRTRDRAERFLAKIKAARRIDYAYWGVPHDAIISPADAFKGHIAPFSVI